MVWLSLKKTSEQTITDLGGQGWAKFLNPWPISRTVSESFPGNHKGWEETLLALYSALWHENKETVGRAFVRLDSREKQAIHLSLTVIVSPPGEEGPGCLLHTRDCQCITVCYSVLKQRPPTPFQITCPPLPGLRSDLEKRKQETPAWRGGKSGCSRIEYPIASGFGGWCIFEQARLLFPGSTTLWL